MNTIYQYQEVSLNTLSAKDSHARVLNSYGADGWQLISILPNMVAIMMRTIEEPKRAYTRRQTETQHAAA
jgi:hypothetical protein